jgi:SpoVK/Ycf46/Vps4 family AAA+-type ATPase
VKAEYQVFKSKVMTSSVESARSLATQVFMATDIPDKLDYIMIGSTNNPLFVPELPAEMDPASLMSVGQFQKSVSFARAAAANTKSHRIIFTAPPKTGSTFVSAMIAKVLKLRRVSLTLNYTLSRTHSVRWRHQ